MKRCVHGVNQVHCKACKAIQRAAKKSLSDNQIDNWRTALLPMLGPYAMIMPESQIEQFRDKFQNDINRLERENTYREEN